MKMKLNDSEALKHYFLTIESYFEREIEFKSVSMHILCLFFVL